MSSFEIINLDLDSELKLILDDKEDELDDRYIRNVEYAIEQKRVKDLERREMAKTRKISRQKLEEQDGIIDKIIIKMANRGSTQPMTSSELISDSQGVLSKSSIKKKLMDAIDARHGGNYKLFKTQRDKETAYFLTDVRSKN